MFLTTNEAGTNEVGTLESRCQNFFLSFSHSFFLFKLSTIKIKNKNIATHCWPKLQHAAGHRSSVARSNALPQQLQVVAAAPCCWPSQQRCEVQRIAAIVPQERCKLQRVAGQCRSNVASCSVASRRAIAVAAAKLYMSDFRPKSVGFLFDVRWTFV